MPVIESLSPIGFHDYELLDCGNFQKLERFGKFITIRPEPQAVWNTSEPITLWEKKAHVRFVPKSSSAGDWKKYKPMPFRWKLGYTLPNHKVIGFHLSLTSFKHVGIFPEQAVNWNYITESVELMKVTQPKVLNLFAYTGGASLAARAAGAEVTHVDSIKQVITWANENQLLSNLSDIRWVVEDALKFVLREVKRGKLYHGIIMDPPAYGHGANGEKWKLEEQIHDLMQAALKLLVPEKYFLILNVYSLGFSSLILENLLRENFTPHHLQLGELFLPDRHGKKLPLGAVARMRKL